jgi:hypothetical protein
LQIPFLSVISGVVLALPIALALSYWIGYGSIRHPATGVLGAFAGALFGFLVILGWVGTFIFSTPLPGANGVATFFGSLLLCSILGVMGCIFTDQIILRRKYSAIGR